MIKFWRGRAVQRVIFALLGLVLAIGLTVIPAFSQTPPNPFRVATEATFPPFEFQQGGQLTGFDIDLMRAIGKEADLNIDFRNLPFDGIIPALQARTVEAAISGMTITAERAQAISFSRPYFRAGLAIAVREDNKTIKNFEDLKGKRIAVQIGTTGALEATKIPGATVSQFDSAALALQELINGRVEAVVNDKPVTLYAIKQAGLRGVKVVGELLTEEFYGIALPKNSPYLQLINDALGRVIESGQYDVIFRQWFGEKPPELPLFAPALKNLQESRFNWGELFYNLIVKGVPWTILLTVLSFLFGLIGGTLVAIALISPYKWLKIICRIYVDFFRGTPMLVQLFLIYFGLPGLFREIGLNIDLDRLPAALFALSLNVAAYLAEIMRGGIQSIDNGQWEACSSLGMSPVQTMHEVIFPQAFRRMLPPLGNEFITLIKDTSLAAVIGFEELFRQGQLMVATTYKAFEIYIAVAVVYLVLTTLSSVVFKRLEIYMDPLHKSKQE
ncbi:ABC transporter permease subunit [Microcystis sp. CS-574]|uniref:Inner membrane amino-acid ABC transporter permease protein yecS n=1 Tax=Microcystis aeruginosa SPC777 TaxID=482300 RepID=S3JVR3_MICAE|nr:MULTISPECIES: ABC transporter permease subunit [Microcystis]NCR97208.1 ABC transporter permease subunit [Microcystis aeruginosa L311-01]OCY14610.1 MAG: ABC transporter substrate-binding protein [Microcystis aeruginosa CACIAM 03]TRU08700.1 MAG: transporter substrate-binding domain-containing protein [Microcystis aeruginosa Ma_MB_F_20061100_S19D]TRU15306.1 MAG: transporter substrate-binding domain-containing protein [Microcystis aeruginosa Ma_MB_F_20061100_S19]EPF23972.1 Inner membrane amino-